MAGLNLSSRSAHYIQIIHFVHISQAMAGHGLWRHLDAEGVGVELRWPAEDGKARLLRRWLLFVDSRG
jgi:hypothetical protein